MQLGLSFALAAAPKSVPAQLHGSQRARCRSAALRRGQSQRVQVMVTAAMPSNVEVSILPTSAEVGKTMNDLIIKEAKAAIARKGSFSLAVPGGSIPTMMGALPSHPEAASVDWSKVHLFFVNERQNEHKCLNLNKDKYADALGIVEIRAPEEGSSTDSAAQYDALLRATDSSIIAANPGSTPSLDMALIGMGNDGHVGSCYPNSEAAAESDFSKLALPVDMPGKQSITLSLTMMGAAATTVVATCGDNKVDAAEAALRLTVASAAWKGPEDGPMPWLEAPAARLAAGPGKVVWMLDEPAAAKYTAA